MQAHDTLEQFVTRVLGDDAADLVRLHGVLYANDRGDPGAGEECLLLFVRGDVLLTPTTRRVKSA